MLRAPPRAPPPAPPSNHPNHPGPIHLASRPRPPADTSPAPTPRPTTARSRAAAPTLSCAPASSTSTTARPALADLDQVVAHPGRHRRQPVGHLVRPLQVRAARTSASCSPATPRGPATRGSSPSWSTTRSPPSSAHRRFDADMPRSTPSSSTAASATASAARSRRSTSSRRTPPPVTLLFDCRRRIRWYRLGALDAPAYLPPSVPRSTRSAPNSASQSRRRLR
jgi:hypothetical protein